MGESDKFRWLERKQKKLDAAAKKKQDQKDA